MRIVMAVWMLSGVASAQMMVHGVTGTVKSVTPSYLAVVSDESAGPNVFHLADGNHVAVNFGTDLRAGSVDAGKFDKVGDFAVVYYYGYGDQRTALAVKDLGQGPFVKATGTVESYDKHSRKLTLKDDAGKEVALTLPEQVVVDTDGGVDLGKKVSLHKGDRVRVTYSAGEPGAVAFLGEML